MVAVVQLVERQVVILDVAGSSPVSHPNGQRAFELLLPALGAAVQPNGKNHGSHQDDRPDADCGNAGSPEGRPDSSEEMPMSSPSSAKRRNYCHQRQGQHVASIPGCTSRTLTKTSSRAVTPLALTAGGGSAHLEFEPARLGRIADRADSDTDHLPQHDAADRGEATALGHRLGRRPRVSLTPIRLRAQPPACADE